MNLKQLKKNVGWRLQLDPCAIRLDALGRENPVRNAGVWAPSNRLRINAVCCLCAPMNRMYTTL
jgi:hypothetical protein